MQRAIALAALALASPALAQERPDTIVVDSIPFATVRDLDGVTARALPADRVGDVARLLPGATAGVTGPLSVRGGRPADLALELDGIPVPAGVRGASTTLPWAFPGFAGQRELVGTGGLGGIALHAGPAGAGSATAGGGFLALRTREGGDRWVARVDARSDELWGRDHSQGWNRLEVTGGGRLGPFRLFAAGTLEGARSVATPPGAADAPIFVVTGVDTRVAVVEDPGNPLSDTTHVDIQAFGQAPATRLPASANSAGQALVRLDWAGAATRVFASAVLAQDQARHFDYQNLHNPAQLGGGRTLSRILSVGASHRLGRVNPVTLEAFVSVQRDRGEDGPLDGAEEADTRDPFGGFLLAPLDLRFGFGDFPVNDELVDNYRRNRPGSRRSPYNLENTNQYSLVDRWRNNPYGTIGFSESGGPVGRLTLFNEDRTVVGARAGFGLGGTAVRLGAEATSWDISNYNHALTSQAGSDVWIESPSGAALWVEDVVRLGQHGSVAVGLRYERFASGARRPYLRENDPASPQFDQWGWFPRISSYGYDGTGWQPDLIEFREDESHSAVGGSVRLAYAASPRLAIRGGFGLYPRRPDFQLVYAGVNTDVVITTPSNTWGTDLGFETVTQGEAGARYDLGAGLALDAAAWIRGVEDEVVRALRTYYDPFLNRPTEVPVFRHVGNGTGGQGLDVVLERTRGALTGWVGWSWENLTAKVETFDGLRTREAPGSRTHTLVVAAQARTPEGWGEGTLLGQLAQGASAAVAFRATSGTSYARCTSVRENAFILAGAGCLALPHDGVGEARLPGQSNLDLRLTKAFAMRGTTLSVFLDARNLLGTENVLNVFSATGRTSSELAEGEWWRADSISYRQEAFANMGVPADGSINLTFGGAPDPRQACAGWRSSSGMQAAPNCIYLIEAERRFGDGDGIFTIAEQRRASEAFYRTEFGRQTFLGPGRRVRVGVSLAL